MPCITGHLLVFEHWPNGRGRASRVGLELGCLSAQIGDNGCQGGHGVGERCGVKFALEIQQQKVQRIAAGNLSMARDMLCEQSNRCHAVGRECLNAIHVQHCDHLSSLNRDETAVILRFRNNRLMVAFGNVRDFDRRSYKLNVHEFEHGNLLCFVLILRIRMNHVFPASSMSIVASSSMIQ